jgi:SAM-dependent methyltransferase
LFQEEIMLKTLARQIPQIDGLVRQRDDLIRQRDDLTRQRDNLIRQRDELTTEVESLRQEVELFRPERQLDGPLYCPLFERLKGYLLALPAGSRVLELGTLRWIADRPTIHSHFAPHVEWIGSDVKAGTDVDIVADAHALTEITGRDQFDCIMAVSVFEHLARPWIAAKEIALALKPGGRVYVLTHFAYPIHGYPNDYFRFTRESLELLFDDAGLFHIETSYAFPAHIWSRQEPFQKNGPAYLNSSLMAVKP